MKHKRLGPISLWFTIFVVVGGGLIVELFAKVTGFRTNRRRLTERS